jgi:integrase/recombinase XerC
LSSNIPGSAGLVLVDGVAHLDEPAAVFEGMVTGWERQQKSRMLGEATIRPRLALLRRFTEFAESYPWSWTPADVEDFTISLTSGEARLAPSTIRGYHLTLRMFCDYLTDARYEWHRQCRDRFAQVPSQVCHEWNTVAHLNEYEGRPERRPLTYDEVQRLFDYADEQVERITTSGRKGALAALRDAQMIKTCYAFGLRRNELCRLDLAEPARPRVGHIRVGPCPLRQGHPRRCPAPADGVGGAGVRLGDRRIAAMGRAGQAIVNAADHPALWVTERLTRVSVDHLNKRFAVLREGAGLDAALTLHCLRHSYVTHLIEFGYPERFVQEQVGHAFAATTAIYTSVSNDFKQKTLKTALKRVYSPDDQRQNEGDR